MFFEVSPLVQAFIKDVTAVLVQGIVTIREGHCYMKAFVSMVAETDVLPNINISMPYLCKIEGQ